MMLIDMHRLFAASMVVMIGCSDVAISPDVSNAPSIQVLFDRQPLSDVQIQLRQSVDGEVLAQAITGLDGKARFAELPSSEPAQYVVTTESFSDGGWMLDPKFSKPQTSPLKALPLAAHPDQRIDLPPASVRMLDPNRRR